MNTTSSPLLDWAWDGSALDRVSGDLHVVVDYGHGALVALIDGLGHGPEAAAAAQAAVIQLEADPSARVEDLIQRCHAALRSTRGAAMSVASIDARTARLSWSGIGNVEACLLRAPKPSLRPDEAIALRGGVVGYVLPSLYVGELDLEQGDTLVMATDGIRAGFTAGLPRDAAPAELAHFILLRHAKGTDDARVLVVRFCTKVR
ncbi:MAG TPA: SpoIIE family protein phosphatase [Burkholderiaceae bacterium]|nr:SpoIIE family protein phosphatase [Burkholderiaceae bacterium]